MFVRQPATNAERAEHREGTCHLFLSLFCPTTLLVLFAVVGEAVLLFLEVVWFSLELGYVFVRDFVRRRNLVIEIQRLGFRVLSLLPLVQRLKYRHHYNYNNMIYFIHI